MKLAFALLAAILAGAAAPQLAPVTGGKGPPELAGRTPGKKQRCLPAPPNMSFAVSEADPHLLMYDDGKTVWVNNLGPSCGFPDSGFVRPDASASYYCKGDFVRAPGALGVLPGPHCVLGDFVPYRK